MVDHHLVQNSAVFVLGAAKSFPGPPSPPSPPTPESEEPTSPIDEFYLPSACASHTAHKRDPEAQRRISGALHVLNTEAASLKNIARLYETDSVTADSFNSAVEAITRHRGQKGKLVLVGVGKSGHIAKKLVASFNSLGIRASFLHPTEALHGDLGEIGRHDTILFITFSGKTSELLLLLPHIDPSLPTIILTSHTRPGSCELIKQRPSMILVPAPIHEPETVSFGVSAPTTSTTMALAVGDALAIISSQSLHSDLSSVFSRNHPGGAIGQDFRKPQTLQDLAIPFRDITVFNTLTPDMKGADVLKAGYDSTTGWVCFGDRLASPSHIRALTTDQLGAPVEQIPGLGACRENWIILAAEARISQAADWIKDMQLSPEDVCDEQSILAVVDPSGEVVGVLEMGQLLRATS